MSNKHLKAARLFAHMMDNQFSVFGFRFGIEGVLGFIPGLGDFIAMGLSLYMVWIAYQMQLPGNKIAQMIFNIVIDTAIGSVPVIGDIGDLFYKANIKNLRILEEYEKELGHKVKFLEVQNI